jgi:hypothetical protein
LKKPKFDLETGQCESPLGNTPLIRQRFFKTEINYYDKFKGGLEIFHPDQDRESVRARTVRNTESKFSAIGIGERKLRSQFRDINGVNLAPDASFLNSALTGLMGKNLSDAKSRKNIHSPFKEKAYSISNKDLRKNRIRVQG